MRVPVVLLLLALPLLTPAAPGPEEAVEAAGAPFREVREALRPPSMRPPVALTGGDEDGVEPPRDRCPDVGRKGHVDAHGCPVTPESRWGDADRDGLMNGRTVAVAADSPLRETLARRGVVHGVLADGRWVFFGEASEGTDPRDPNTDRWDRLGDGFEVAMRHGIARAAAVRGYGSHVVEPEGAPRADPLHPDDYLEIHPALVGQTKYWNAALEAALAEVVADDLAPEGNATYAPPKVRLHAIVEDAIPLPDGTLTVEEVQVPSGEPTQVQQHLLKARERVATYVVVVPRVEWDGVEVAGLAIGDVLLVAVEHKGFDVCEAEGGRPGTPACDRLMELFRWTLNHERLHPYGLMDTYGKDELMSTATGVHAPRPWESKARFDFVTRPDQLVLDWRQRGYAFGP